MPEGHDLPDLLHVLPTLFGYLLSFVFVGIYWNNHHHLLQAVHKVNGVILWANLHLLFWLSLVPFATSWMGHSGLHGGPIAFYGLVLFMAGFAYWVLARALVAHHGDDSVLARAMGGGLKEYLSLASYLLAIVAAFFQPIVSIVLYVFVAVMWLVPDTRIEKHLENASR